MEAHGTQFPKTIEKGSCIRLISYTCKYPRCTTHTCFESVNCVFLCYISLDNVEKLLKFRMGYDVSVTVNLEIFARALFLWMRSFVTIKLLRNGEITISFTGAGQSCPS